MRKLEEQLQVETDASFLYHELAELQDDPAIKAVLLKLAEIEQSHAAALVEKIRKVKPAYTPPGPSRRARLQMRLGKIFGYDFIISGLAGVEQQAAAAAIHGKLQRGEQPSGFEHNHLRIIEAVAKKQGKSVSGGFLSKLEGRHKTVGGNALRAAVLGANDGLVSNMSLVMGVAGAEAANTTILVTGFAGLLAGAISMALGEWLSVQSSRELLQKQIALEAEELEASPEQERKELELLYQAKGMDAKSAEELSHRLISNKETALDTLIREELGIDKEELGGSAWEAAFTSFFLFAIGAIIPVIAFIFTSGNHAVYISLGSSVIGLFFIGAAITLFTGKSIIFSGLRQVMFGLAAAGVTYAIGKLIGVSIAG